MIFGQPPIGAEDGEGLIYRIDNLCLPPAARDDFEAGARRNIEFVRELPGYRGHWVFEKTGGPGAFNLMAVAAWASQEDYAQAASRVSEYYQRIGFDRNATLAKWGGRSEVAEFRALTIR